jgi:hypothetical protein
MIGQGAERLTQQTSGLERAASQGEPGRAFFRNEAAKAFVAATALRRASETRPGRGF